MNKCLLRVWGIGIIFAVGMSGCASLSPRGVRSAPAETPITGAFVNPLTGSRVISLFGPRGRKMHEGVDLKKNEYGGDIVVAARVGTVEMARRCRGYGLMVDILHSDGSHTRYAHLKKLLVNKHQQVAEGQRIGIVGSTGNASTPHLHFEIRTSLGRCVDPSQYLQRITQSGQPDHQMAKTVSQHADEGNEVLPGEVRSKKYFMPGSTSGKTGGDRN